MADHLHQPDLTTLRQRIEDLWQQYLDPQISERERRCIGWAIDATFEQIRNCPEWMEAFLSTEPWQ